MISQGSGRRASAAILALSVAVSACGGGSPTEPGMDLSDSVSLQGSSTLVFQDSGRLGDGRGDVERLVRETLATAAAQVSLERVTVVVATGTDTVIPELGFGGRADAGTVRMVFNTGSSLWQATLEAEFPPLLAHELHHVARIRAVGFPDHLLDALVLEGLADQFSRELLATPDAIWAVALTGSELELWSQRAAENYFNTDYNHNAWFFGTGNPPRWAGYSVGYKLAGDFLSANPGRTAASSVAEPSASFVGGTRR